MKNLNDHLFLRGVLVGVFLVLVLLPIGGYLYMRYGPVPVATSDTPFPDERQIVHIALDARINRSLQTTAVSATPENLVSGAHLFVQNCAVCHGTPNQASDLAKAMYPTAPQLWTKNVNGVTGVSDDEPGISFWKIKNGIRLTGMPSFNSILSDNEMWQVAVLLHEAGHPLPTTVTDILNSATPPVKGSAEASGARSRQ
jgi:mono/diheme cytochrome c family protein